MNERQRSTFYVHEARGEPIAVILSLGHTHGKTTQKLQNDIRCSKTHFTQWAFLNKEQQAVSTTKAKGLSQAKAWFNAKRTTDFHGLIVKIFLDNNIFTIF